MTLETEQTRRVHVKLAKIKRGNQVDKVLQEFTRCAAQLEPSSCSTDHQG